MTLVQLIIAWVALGIMTICYIAVIRLNKQLLKQLQEARMLNQELIEQINREHPTKDAEC